MYVYTLFSIQGYEALKSRLSFILTSSTTPTKGVSHTTSHSKYENNRKPAKDKTDFLPH